MKKTLISIILFSIIFTLCFNNKKIEVTKKYLKENNYINDVSTYLKKNGFNSYNNTDITYYEVGEKVYDSMLKELKKANDYIYLEFFTIKDSKMWDGILEILKEKASYGVDVRIIYDDIGSFNTISRNYYEILDSYGIKAYPFNRVSIFSIFNLNNRDHRKIIIIDGKVAFTGGVNLADQYINLDHTFGHWKDNGVMIKGEAVLSFLKIFLENYEYVSHEIVDYSFYDITDQSSDNYIIPYSDSPLKMIGENVYLNLINNASKYIYITTPYLIIDDEFKASLINVAKKGIDVRIIVPKIPDRKFVNEVTKSYYEELMKNGIKIYEYEQGFIHSKIFVVDDIYATVGSVNLDYRSFYSQYECGVLIYKNDVIKDIKIDIINVLNKSKLITKNDLKKDRLTLFKRSILKQFERLM